MAELEFRDLRADEIDCRVSTISEKGLTLLLYKDARCDMAILDETVGSLNWQRSHSRDNANCTVSIWDSEKQMWICKEDVGTESNTEAAKGLASDSFKRACFNWGIGRELYTAPVIKIWSPACKIESWKGKWACFDKFKVQEITITEKKIVALSIINESTGETVFEFKDGKKKRTASGKTDKKQQEPKQEPKQPEPKQPEPVQESRDETEDDPAEQARKAAYYNLIKYCSDKKLDPVNICQICNLTKDSSQKEFEDAQAYAEALITMTGGEG